MLSKPKSLFYSSEWNKSVKNSACRTADDWQIENNVTLGEICNTLRGVWGDAKRVAEGF